MLLPLYTKIVKREYPEISTKVMILQPVSVVENGRIGKTSEFKEFDIADSLSAFKSSDFSIGSLEAAGALSKLKTTYMANTSSMNVADTFENLKFEQNVAS